MAGEIAGAALDVLETEPPEPGDALVNHERVVVTPHAAWYSEESFVALKTEVAREGVRVLSGKPPRSPVNEPADQFHGDRAGSLRDPFGHRWMLATHTEDMSEAEMQRRMEEAMSTT